MFGFLKALFRDEKARKAVDAKTSVPAKAPLQSRTGGKPPAVSPERAELIRNAQRVHKAKRKILDALSDEDRARLLAVAITSFLAEADHLDNEPTKKKPKK